MVDRKFIEARNFEFLCEGRRSLSDRSNLLSKVHLHGLLSGKFSPQEIFLRSTKKKF